MATSSDVAKWISNPKLLAAKNEISVGSRVLTTAGKKGVVAFLGEAQFATGEWVGVVLDTPDGKNDGSVANVRYFTCTANHGLFVKKAQLKLDRDAVDSGTARSSAVSDTKEKLALLRQKRLAKEAADDKEGAAPNAAAPNSGIKIFYAIVIYL
jgi:dynactin complex subunit